MVLLVEADCPSHCADLDHQTDGALDDLDFDAAPVAAAADVAVALVSIEFAKAVLLAAVATLVSATDIAEFAAAVAA